jgi:transcriptional regulator with XRE-family HTH domain
MGALADLLGVDPSTVRAWEQRGHRPRPRLQARLVEVLGLPTAGTDAEATFGERLRAARPRAGLTQRELADQVGVGQQMVSDWESGRKKPRGRERAWIAEIIGMGSR